MPRHPSPPANHQAPTRGILDGTRAQLSPSPTCARRHACVPRLALSCADLRHPSARARAAAAVPPPLPPPPRRSTAPTLPTPPQRPTPTVGLRLPMHPPSRTTYHRRTRTRTTSMPSRSTTSTPSPRRRQPTRRRRLSRPWQPAPPSTPPRPTPPPPPLPPPPRRRRPRRRSRPMRHMRWRANGSSSRRWRGARARASTTAATLCRCTTSIQPARCRASSLAAPPSAPSTTSPNLYGDQCLAALASLVMQLTHHDRPRCGIVRCTPSAAVRWFDPTCASVTASFSTLHSPRPSDSFAAFTYVEYNKH